MSEQGLGFRKTGAGQQLGVIVPEGTPEAPAPSTVPTPNTSPTPSSTPRPAPGGSTSEGR